MTYDERVEAWSEENGYKICSLADDPGQVCYNPDHCEQCEKEYEVWLESKGEKA